MYPIFRHGHLRPTHQPMFGSMYKEKKKLVLPAWEKKRLQKTETINLLLKSSPPCLPLKIASLGWFQHFLRLHV